MPSYVARVPRSIVFDRERKSLPEAREVNADRPARCARKSILQGVDRQFARDQDQRTARRWNKERSLRCYARRDATGAAEYVDEPKYHLCQQARAGDRRITSFVVAQRAVRTCQTSCSRDGLGRQKTHWGGRPGSRALVPFERGSLYGERHVPATISHARCVTLPFP
jgi:hypothetical protein